ncbi:MAG: hypothetical protein J0H94_09310 [Rhizobiales bacterium]|jgi:hypothetical protein|nr:hypothetical protein [Hyphomicrobiales bacterium]
MAQRKDAQGADRKEKQKMELTLIPQNDRDYDRPAESGVGTDRGIPSGGL